METAIFFCFVSAFLCTQTLGMIWFLPEDIAKTDEFNQADLRTLFHLVRVELAAGRRVIIAAPPMLFSPPLGTDFNFLIRWSDPNNNWIDAETGLPYRYAIDGRFQNTEFDQGLINVVSLETREDMDVDGWLNFNLTVRIDDMTMYSFLTSNGTWRIYDFEIERSLFASFFSNVEIRYEARFHLTRGVGLHSGHWFLQQSIGQSAITINRMTVAFIGASNQEFQTVFYWDRDRWAENDGQHVDEMFRTVLSEAIPYRREAIDSLINGFLGSRPYIIPHITLAPTATNVSGYSCREHSPRRRRETNLRMQPIDVIVSPINV